MNCNQWQVNFQRLRETYGEWWGWFEGTSFAVSNQAFSSSYWGYTTSGGCLQLCTLIKRSNKTTYCWLASKTLYFGCCYNYSSKEWTHDKPNTGSACSQGFWSLYDALYSDEYQMKVNFQLVTARFCSYLQL